MSTRAKGRSSSRKTSTSYMDNNQFASYLAELRNNRVSRPGGARPLPSSNREPGRSADPNRKSLGAASLASSAAVSDTSSQHATHQRSQSDVPPAHTAHAAHTARTASSKPPPISYSRKPSYGSSFVGSVSSRYSTVSGHGRDYYPDRASKQAPRPLRPDEVVPTDTYMESGQRWMEKEEAVALRQAMEDLDIKKGYKTAPAEDASNDDEQRLYNAALNEAAELVYQHQNGIKPPEPGAPYQYKQHLRKNSYAHARTASVGMYGNDIQPTGLARDPTYRSVSDSSASSADLGSHRSRYSFGSKRVASGASGASDNSNSSSNSNGRASDNQTRNIDERATAAAPPSNVMMRAKAYAGLAGGPRPMIPSAFGTSKSSRAGRRRSSMKRNISGEIEKPFSGDQIYEEPETSTPEKRKTPVAGSVLQSASKKRVASLGNANALSANSPVAKDASAVSKIVSRYEIHRNPPSQSRNPQYTTSPAVTPKNYTQQPEAAAADTPRKNGVEIRSDDIREATSMKLKDRNPKLPTPSYVSDNPGRPIVSFDAEWKAPEDEAATDPKPDARQHHPPTTNVPVPVPSTHRQEPSIPHVAPVAHPWTATQQSTQHHHQHASSAAAAPPPPPPQTADRPLPLRVGPRHEPSTFQVSQSRGGMQMVPAITVSTDSPAPGTPACAAPTPATQSRSPLPVPPIPTIGVSEDVPPPTTQQPRAPIPTIVLPGGSEEEEEEVAKTTPQSSMPNIPIIVTPDGGHDEAPQSHNKPPVPTIVTPDEHVASSGPPKTQPRSSRPLPTPSVPAASAASSSRRPLPTPGNAASRFFRGHWSRAAAPSAGHPSRTASTVSSASSSSSATHNRATALCHECRQPIVGRFVALKGLQCSESSAGSIGPSGNGGNGTERFHPQCFRCYACGTSLEALEISPEPDQFREARLGRMARRAAGEILEENPGETMAEDGDERLRFYCHLDWHELFAPRCKHCTTPIVGEHVYALGAHWHVGHFFCAECGDPFPPGATHIEKDGYAWCVGCQTRRTERRAPKCRACGTAVIGAYVQALGAEWHDGCFRCGVCGGGFADGQVFPREGQRGLMQVVCTGCRERELKA